VTIGSSFRKSVLEIKDARSSDCIDETKKDATVQRRLMSYVTLIGFNRRRLTASQVDEHRELPRH